MPDPFAPEGVLPNVLRWIDRPGQAVRNVLSGRPAAAGRQLLDFLGEAVDAPLPGDWIPSATSREDYVSGSELLGMEQTPGLGRTAADVGVGLLTDPLTYLSFGAVPAAKGALKHTVNVGLPFYSKATVPLAEFSQAMDPLSVVMRTGDIGAKGVLGALDKAMASKTVEGVQRTPLTTGYEGLKTTVRRAAGAEALSDDVRDKLSQAAATGSTGSKVYLAQIEEAAKGLTLDERRLLGKALHGVDIQGGKAVALGPNYQANILQLVGGDAAKAQRLEAAANKFLDIGERQWQEGVAKGLFDDNGGQLNYIQRQWTLPVDEAEEFARATAAPGQANALESRVLQTPQDIADFFNTGKVGFETDIGKLMADRASQQGRMLSQAKTAQAFGGTGTLAGDLRQTAMEQVKTQLDAGLLTPDEAYRVQQAVQGMKPREGVFKALAKFSSLVKGPMVYGVVLPKVGSLNRNKLGMVFQALATPGAREQAWPQLKSWLGDIGRSFDEAYGDVVFGTGKSFARGDEIGKGISAIEDAIKAAKTGDDVPQILRSKGRDDLASAVENGVLDGFVSTEELLSKLSRSPNLQKMKDIYDAPAVMFQSMEQRGRLQMFLNLRKELGDKKAAATTKDALYDYGISSPENRTLRDVLPFAQFMAKSIPQQAKLLSQRPAVAAGLAPLFYDASGEEGPVYPWMQGKSRIGVGQDEAGNALYLSGFGLPVESLDMIPNLSGGLREAGRDISQGLLSSTQPLLKTAAAITTGVDPYFGTPFGSYDKLPIVGSAGEAGRAYNVLAGTGLLEPLGGGIARQIGQAVDERKPVATRAADLLTGAKLISVDPNIAEQQVLTDYLSRRPEVAQRRTFYQTGEDAELTELMSQLQAAKQRARKAKEAAAAAQ